VFPHLRQLTILAEKPLLDMFVRNPPPSYSTAVLQSLVSLLSSSPLRSLCLNLTFRSLHELHVFAPLTRLEELVEGSHAVPGNFTRRRTVSRREVEQQLLSPQLVGDDEKEWGEWWSDRFVFEQERTCRARDGRWLNGREAFFDFLDGPAPIGEEW
jgi:hypothetical protein